MAVRVSRESAEFNRFAAVADVDIFLLIQK